MRRRLGAGLHSTVLWGAPKRNLHIVATFYPRPEKPKRGSFRYSAIWLLRRINVARKSHSYPTNGLQANPPRSRPQDGQHL